MPVSLAKEWTQFNDCLTVDMFTLADTSGVQKIFVKCCDFSSRFGVCAPIGSRHPLLVWQTFLERWASRAGFPHNFLIDGGGEFEAEFRQEAESVPARVHTTAAYSSNQHGVCERHGGYWKSVARHLIDEFSMKWTGDVRSARVIASAT